MSAVLADPASSRATFFEGQILAAADLNAIVEGARIALAQHERYLHLPGIAAGLTLTATERQTATGETFQDITVEPGIVIDGTGRHLVLATAERLSEDDFDQLNIAINDPLAYYPVFILGRDETSAITATTFGSCASTAPTRVQEVAQITFGRVDEAADSGNVPVDDFMSGPSGTSGERPWRTLLGFVQWDAAIKRFIAVKNDHDGVSRQYAGVQADDVVARGGLLALRSAAKGQNGTPVVEVDAAVGELRFGAQNSSGKVVPVFTVKANGDLQAAGKISGAIAKGVQIQTGSASDGMLLPLPAGITQAQVDSGTVTVQAHVTPHYGVPALPSLNAGELWLMTPIECRVIDRRVFCRVRWTATDNSVGPFNLPGVCDYSLMAFTAE
jgi:hypothetical protein